MSGFRYQMKLGAGDVHRQGADDVWRRCEIAIGGQQECRGLDSFELCQRLFNERRLRRGSALLRSRVAWYLDTRLPFRAIPGGHDFVMCEIGADHDLMSIRWADSIK